MAHGSGLLRLQAALEQRDSHVRSHGGYYTAQCPAHDDSIASLSFTQGDKGATLKCHAGCENGDVIRELDLSWPDLFDENSRDKDDSGTAADLWMPCQLNGCGGHKAAEYRYVDAHGALLYAVARCSRKSEGCPAPFAQWRPDASKRFGKAWGLPGSIQRVLYRLPKVLDAARNGRRVYLVEGEKDVERMEMDFPGETATTGPSGGGKGKWRREFTRCFRGASEVIIVADCDRPGLEYAEEAYGHISKVVEKVTVVCSPLMVDGADFSDHRDYGYGLEDLETVPFETAPRRPQMVICVEERHLDVPVVFEGFSQESVERFLCGSMLRFGLGYDISPADIQDKRLKTVVEAIALLVAEEHALTPETVAVRVEENGQGTYEKVLDFLLELEKCAFSDTEKPRRAARVLRERSSRRGITFSLRATAEAIRDEHRKIPEVLDHMRRMADVQAEQYAAISHAYAEPVTGDAFEEDLLAEVAREEGLTKPAAPAANVRELRPGVTRERAAQHG